MGSREWYQSLAFPSNLRQNLWTFTPLKKPCAFIQSFEQSKCTSASSSGFPENSGLKFNQFKCNVFVVDLLGLEFVAVVVADFAVVVVIG